MCPFGLKCVIFYIVWAKDYFYEQSSRSKESSKFLLPIHCFFATYSLIAAVEVGEFQCKCSLDIFQFASECDLQCPRCTGEEELNRWTTVFVFLFSLYETKQKLDSSALSSSTLNTCTLVARFQKASFLQEHFSSSLSQT